MEFPKIPLKKSPFTEMLIEENALDQYGFESWIFCNGMTFNSPDKWWGDFGFRDFPHEGIDLCLYQDKSGKVRRLDSSTRIRVMHEGQIKAMFRDYLGQAIVIEHKKPQNEGERFVSMYAHTQPQDAIEVGRVVEAGDVIATIADTRNAKASILPHLHLSLGLPSDAFSFEGMVWNIVRNPQMMTLLDPLPVIDYPHQILDVNNPVCRLKIDRIP
jgi:murein DD-endopeptidase MepM/ murein hydrolase activator NlpD